ncbi:MAG: hypothetical protein JWN04_4972 [Myxococcaceae bacterium]|nr:hypothetical protein [Myxococcaceae bacterium]
MESYRAYRHLAQGLAAAGISVLRLDYYGTGNSAGGLREEAMVRRWTDSIREAITELKRRTGLARVALAGLRMGGSLAALAANGRDDVSAMAFWEPCANGRAYVRQIQMLGMANEHSENLPSEMGIEAAGFLFTRPTMADLSALQLTKLEKLPKVPMLLLSRDDFPEDRKFAAHLEHVGATVDQASFAGYVKLMTATHESKLPEPALVDLVSWFEGVFPEPPLTATENAPAGESPSYPSERVVSAPSGAAEVTERLAHFGQGLFGVLTAPTSRRFNKPAVLLLNTSADHHVGPHRLYVPLSREWASQGYAVLRFDIAGVGASQARPGELESNPYPAHAVYDIGDAVTYLEQQGYDKVILAGLCSGAYHAVQAAHRGVPVAGALAVNLPFQFAPDLSTLDPIWNDVEMAILGRNLFSTRKWARFFNGQIRYRYILGLLADRARLTLISALPKPLRGAAALEVKKAKTTDFSELLTPIPMHLIFSNGDPGLGFFEQAIGEMRPRVMARKGFSMEVLDDADHTFMSVRLQGALVSVLTEALHRQTEAMSTPPMSAAMYAPESAK